MKKSQIDAFRSAFSLYDVQDHALTLNGFEKTASYNLLDHSTRYCMDVLRQSGFSRIERLVHKADGKTAALDCIMPEAWDLTGRSYLKITSGDMPEYERLIADTARHPLEAMIWSAPTPHGGVDCELVDYASLDREHPDVKGKWVFIAAGENGFTGKCYRRLAEAGAAGLALTDLQLLESAPDDKVWFNGQGYTGWYHEKEAPRLPVFSIAPRRGVKLLDQLKKGKVTVHAEMNTQIYDGKIYTVTGVIPGESEEEYALFAHIYEPFIADDALGFAAACEIGRLMLQRKVRLKKTLRVVFSMELYGFSAYLADPERRKRIQAALSMDSFCYQRREFNFRLSPVCMPFFTDWVYRDIYKFLPDFERSEMRGNLSDDTFGGDPAIGIPTNWFWTPSRIFHHNSGKYFEPDWRIVKEKVPVLAAAVESLLTLDLPDDLNRRALRDFRKAAAEVMKNRSLPQYERSILLDAEYFRYSQMLLSWRKYCGADADTAPLEKSYSGLKAKLGEIRYQGLNRAEKQALAMVPERLFLGHPFCQSLIPYAERRPVKLPRLVWALFDGRRNLLECIRISDRETGTHSSKDNICSIIDILHFLEKYGYVRVKSSSTSSPELRK